MRLFKRAKHAHAAPKCPGCGERLPAGALECSMCGRDLVSAQSAVQAPGGEEREFGVGGRSRRPRSSASFSSRLTGPPMHNGP